MAAWLRGFAVVTVALFFFSCLALVSLKSAPEGVEATQGSEEDRVIITWEPVERAGVYHVYRSESKEGKYEYLASTDGTDYIDVTVAPLVRYWYRVAAADYLSRPESEKLSIPVEGWCIHVFSWSGSVVATGAAGFDAAPNAATPGELFVCWYGAGESAVTLEVYRDEQWQSVGEPVGVTDGDIQGSVTVAESGSVPYLAYRDQTTGGKLTAVKLEGNGEDAAWVPLEDPGQGSVPVRELRSTVVGGYLYVAALDDTTPATDPAPLLVFRYSDSTGWTDISPEPPVSTSAPSLTNDGSAPIIAYENGAGSVSVRQYDGGNWVDTGTPFPYAGDDVPDGYLDSGFDPATSTYVLSFYDSGPGALKAFSYDGSVWTDMNPAVDAAPDAASVSVSAEEGIVYLFYKDRQSNRGTVISYAESQWQPVPQNETTVGITGQFNVDELDIEAVQFTIFAIAREANTVNADIYR